MGKQVVLKGFYETPHWYCVVMGVKSMISY